MMSDMVVELLMIDDDKDQYDSIKNYAALPPRNILLRYASNLEDGINILEQNKQISGVILDGKGLLHADTVNHFPTEAFVHAAITKIRLLEHKAKRKLPFVVLTAWYEFLVESLAPQGIQVFDKKAFGLYDSIKAELFSYLLEKINPEPEVAIRIKFRRYFKLFDEGLLSGEVEEYLMKALLMLETDVLEDGHFNNLRIVEEAIVSRLLHWLAENGEQGARQLLELSGSSGFLLRYAKYYLQGNDVRNKDIVLLEKRSDDARPIPREFCAAIDYVKNICDGPSHLYTSSLSRQQNLSLIRAIVFSILFQMEVLEGVIHLA